MRKHILMLLAVFTVLAAVVPARASTATVLHTFCAKKGPACPAGGAHPIGDLITDGAGNIYGVTNAGGTGTACHGGCGVVFELQPGDANAYTVLYNFQGGTADGAYPKAGLVLDPSGTLYGTTSAGGSTNCTGGCGTVFSVVPGSGSDSILHFFTGDGTGDGANPTSELLEDGLGDLFGTTQNGGTGACTGGCGTVFLLQPGSSYDVLHSFTASDGANPVAGLAFDGPGNLWGTALNGGADGFGTIFELSASSGFTTLTVTHNFQGAPTDGANPAAALVFDEFDIDGGYLYGTTAAGGSGSCSGGCGIVFEQQPVTRAYEAIHSFIGKDGTTPVARLALETDSSNANYGSLYGTASLGGTITGRCAPSGCGTAFEICPPGAPGGCPKGGGWVKAEYTLFRFNGTKGKTPLGGMLLFPPAALRGFGIQPPQIGKGTCSPSCVGGADQGGGGTGNSGDIVQLTN